MSRPTIQFDYDEIYEISKTHCSFMDMAKYFNVSEGTINNRYKEDTEFKIAVDKGRFEAIKGRRRRQIETAMDGNTQMLVWLGKQLLGQTEKVDVDQLSRVEPISIQIVDPNESL